MTKISGSAGNLTYRILEGKQVMMGRIQKMTNPKTALQVNQRIKFPNIVAMYRAFHGLLKESFEKKRKGRRSKDVSDFNRFMSANLQSAPVFLTQSESAAGYSFAGYGGRSCAHTFAIQKDDKVVLEGSQLGGNGSVQVVYGTTNKESDEHKVTDLTVVTRTNNRIEATVPEEAAGYCFGFYVTPRMVAVYVGEQQNPGTGGDRPEIE